jgi:hypothetical protein
LIENKSNHILTEGDDMKSSSIQLLLTGVAACISLTFFMTPTYGSSIVIGGNWTDIGTITFVSPKPGDSPTTAGTALLNTINGITDNSATNPYLIKLGPGIYDLGAVSLQMKEYVDLEGSGENVTIITGNIGSGSSGVVQGANNAEIRFLTVKQTGGGNYAFGIYNNSASPKITNVTASASGGTVDNQAVRNVSSSSPTMTNVTVSALGGASNFGVFNLSSSPTMTNVTVFASGATTNYGIKNDTSSTTMTNVTVFASGGTINYGVHSVGSCTVRINHSVIKATTNTLRNTSGATTLVGNTQLDGGGVVNSGSTLTCVGAYDENYLALNTSCQ